MIELKNVELELDRFRGRLFAAAVFVLVLLRLLAARLVYLQVFSHEDLATQAEANRIAVVPVVPNRGLIVDRNGVVLATNYSAYTLEITPSRRGADLDALIDALAERGRDRRRATAAASSACWKRARASTRCRSAPSSATRKWRASWRSASVSRAST